MPAARTRQPSSTWKRSGAARRSPRTEDGNKSGRKDGGERARADPFAGWDAQERATLEASLAATPAQRLERLEEVLKIAWGAGALPEDEAGSGQGKPPGSG